MRKDSNVNNEEPQVMFCTVVSEASCSWSSRDLKVFVSLTAGKTDAWVASAELGREGTGVAGDTRVAKGTASTFLFCSKQMLLDTWLKMSSD